MGNVTVKESGGMASFVTPYVRDIKSLKVNFNPVQEGSGDPSLNNIRPIKKWNDITIKHRGKNLIYLPPVTNSDPNGLHAEIVDGKLKITGTATKDTQTVYTSPGNSIFVDYNFMEYEFPAGNYKITSYGFIAQQSSDRVIINTKYADGSAVDGIDSGGSRISCLSNVTGTPEGQVKTINATKTFRMAVPYIYIKEGSTMNCTAQIWMTREEEFGDYTPYQGNNITVNLSNSFADIAGGSLDLISGELIVNEVCITFDGTESWQKISGNSADCDFFYYTYDKSLLGSDISKQRCSHYKSLWITTTNNVIGQSTTLTSTSTYGIRFRPDLSQISTVEQWTTFLTNQHSAGTPVQCWVTLKTPITYQLNPQQLSTLKGANNIWSNGDSVEVEYELSETFDIQKAKRRIILNQPHVESASGGIVSFDTDMKAPLKDEIIHLEPVQEGSGEPSLTNIRPISGWDEVTVIKCGKNLLMPYVNATKGGITYTVEEDGSVHASGQRTETTSQTQFILTLYNNDKTLLKDDIMLAYGGCENDLNNTTGWDIYPWDITTNARPKQSSTSQDNAVSVSNSTDVEVAFLPGGHKFRMNIRRTGSTAQTDIVFHPWVSIYDPNETQSFEKPSRETLNISWANDIGTIYGGSLNLVTGELVTDKVFFTFDGTETWIHGNSSNPTNMYFRYYYYDDTIPAQSSNAFRACSHFPNAEIYNSTSYIGYTAYTSSSAPNEGWLNIRPDLTQISTLQQWKDFLAQQYAAGTPVQCVFTKTHPVTYNFTPQQLLTRKGKNNIWSNANGDIEIKYWTH